VLTNGRVAETKAIGYESGQAVLVAVQASVEALEGTGRILHNAEEALATRLEDVEAYLFPFIQTCLPTSAPLANFLNANFLINIPGWTQQTNGQVTAASVVSAIALPLDIDVPGNVCVVGAVNSFGDVEALALGSGESNAILEALTAEDGRPQEPVRLLVPHPLVQELTRMRDANLSKYGHMTIIGYASIVELLRLSGRTTSRTC
jgi:hypothetical protein